jgi:hypothetical protein
VTNGGEEMQQPTDEQLVSSIRHCAIQLRAAIKTARAAGLSVSFYTAVLPDYLRGIEDNDPITITRSY